MLGIIPFAQVLQPPSFRPSVQVPRPHPDEPVAPSPASQADDAYDQREKHALVPKWD